MHVLLIGPRASGKSSVGRRLAERLNLPFIDLDDRVLDRFEQATVKEVWDAHGESAWRAAEVDALGMLLAEPEPAVVALGGGTPVIEQAEAMLNEARTRSRTFTVYLRGSVESLAARLRHAPGDRPSLTGDDVVGEIESVLERRAPIYEALADLICDTDDCDAEHLAALIEHELHRRRYG